MGDDEGEKPIIALKKLLVKTRLERDSARATIAEQAKRILTLEEQLAKARKELEACAEADKLFSRSIQKSPDDVKETGTAAPFTPARTTMGRHDRLATSVAKKLMKKQEEGVSASPDTRVKNPKKLPEPSPEPVTPPKKEYRI
jgi:chromosome segregation ATPase